MRLCFLDDHIARDTALAGMNDPGFGPRPALNVARYEADAARSAVSGPAMKRYFDALTESRVEQQVSLPRVKSFAVDSNSMVFWHCLIPFGVQPPTIA